VHVRHAAVAGQRFADAEASGRNLSV
jgi:hypothetical protein